MNGFCFDQNNCCLWILIILLILCVCKSGCLNGFLNSCYAVPAAIALAYCLCKNGGFGGMGCGCNNNCGCCK